jgi:hypothetical protein
MPTEYSINESGEFTIEEGADISAAIHQALGYASVCWDDGPSGVFQSEKAHDAALKLEAYLFPAAHASAGAPDRLARLRTTSAETIADVGAIERPVTSGIFGGAYGHEDDERDTARPVTGSPIEDNLSKATAEWGISDMGRITGAQRTIDQDPEFWHGLTLWGSATDVASTRDCGWAAQIRDSHVQFMFNDNEFEVPAEEARRLRDLLNVATARGAL